MGSTEPPEEHQKAVSAPNKVVQKEGLFSGAAASSLFTSPAPEVSSGTLSGLEANQAKHWGRKSVRYAYALKGPWEEQNPESIFVGGYAAAGQRAPSRASTHLFWVSIKEGLEYEEEGAAPAQPSSNFGNSARDQFDRSERGIQGMLQCVR